MAAEGRERLHHWVVLRCCGLKRLGGLVRHAVSNLLAAAVGRERAHAEVHELIEHRDLALLVEQLRGGGRAARRRRCRA